MKLECVEEFGDLKCKEGILGEATAYEFEKESSSDEIEEKFGNNYFPGLFTGARFI